MSAGKRASIAAAITERMAAPPDSREGKRFITFPVSPRVKVQFDVMAAQIGRGKEDLMREALHDLMLKHGVDPLE